MRCSVVSRVRRYVAAAIIAVAASGCATGPPEEAYRLPPTTLEVREMETRTFEANEKMIIGACVALLQDMEYNIDAVETQLGVLTASKVVDADSVAQKAGLIALDVVNVIVSALAGGSPGGSAYQGADDKIGLDLTLVVLPSLAREGDYTARFTVQTTLYDKAGRVKERNVTQEPLVYQEIFEKLSKALFLESQSP
jgi:hypothetical protein